MKQIIQAVQSTIKGKFVLFLTAVFLLVPTAACAQVITSPDEQAEPFWPEQEQVTPSTQPNPIANQNQEPPYGTVVMMQKSVKCNDTSVIKNYIQNTGGMTPITFGTNLNEMGAITSLIQVYANPLNKRFAIIEHFAMQKSCILTHGNSFEIIVPPQPQEVPN